ncbi:MAG: transglutaminase domain-containing protein [Alphaproteobacteria bacterium]|nr:transglutaminase domain-containing protein [Alphaproteobacteria bacterium]MBL6937132.1 transglutaminase domain-containing protein [Alphaproteobacteria bacterium]MBL7096306.1 transglutaminase domain-containing protein [Alphaproteobacteria bacterium]
MRTLPPDIAGFYTKPAHMTDPRELDAVLEGAPSDIPGLVAFIQNLLIHPFWAAAYHQQLSPARQDEVHTRSVHDMLARMQTHDPRPLGFVRTLAQRAVGNCRHFSTFGTALFRRAGIPARARCGFGMYFEAGKGVDHWLIEYWNGTAWQFLDAQIDAMQRALLRLPFDPLNVPREQFLTGGNAWAQHRAGQIDAKKFGILDMWGDWFIAGNLIRDVASLNNMEMLPWDSWGTMTGPGESISPEKVELYDRLATLAADPDRHFAELRAIYDDSRIHVPHQIFNAMRQRTETV